MLQEYKDLASKLAFLYPKYQHIVQNLTIESTMPVSIQGMARPLHRGSHYWQVETTNAHLITM